MWISSVSFREYGDLVYWMVVNWKEWKGGGGVDLNSKILESVVEGSRGIVGNSVFVDFFDNWFRYCVD